MVWQAFCSRRKLPLLFDDGTLNSVRYTELLANTLLSFCEGTYNNSCRFQHDNAAPHVALNTEGWVLSEGVDVIDWPSCSPDLNPVENLWEMLSEEVYSGHKQYDTIDDLKEAMFITWDNINTSTSKTLATSMTDRCVSVLICYVRNLMVFSYCSKILD